VPADDPVAVAWRERHIDTPGQGYLLVDGDGVVLRADAEAARLTGRAVDGLCGKPAADALSVTGGRTLGDVLAETRTGGLGSFVAACGTGAVPMTANCVRTSPPGEAFTLFMVSIREGEQVERAAFVSSGPVGLQFTFDQMAVGIVMAGLDGSVLVINQAMRQMIGSGDYGVRCIHADDMDATIMAIIPCIRGERDGYAMDKRLLHADGSTVWVHEKLTMVRDTDGRALHYFSQFIDITERKLAEQQLVEREAQVKFLSDGLPVALIEVGADRAIRNGNAVLADLLGGDPVGRDVRDVIHPDDLGTLTHLTEAGGDDIVAEFRVRRLDGDLRWVRNHSRMHRDPGSDFVSSIGTWTDITEEVRMRIVSRQFGEVLESIPDVVAVSDPDGRIQYLNQAGRALVGAEGELPAGLRLDAVVADNGDTAVLGAALGQAVRDGWWTGELDLAGGDARHVSATITAHAGAEDDAPFLSVLTRDITALKRAEAALRRQATTDALTGLRNRAGFFDRLVAALDRATVNDVSVGLLFVDLDRFKPVNDRLGHDAGDQLLVQVAARLQAAVRTTDSVARLGGDEFVVILEPLGEPAEAESVGGRLLAALAEPYVLDAGTAAISASLGLAISDRSSTAQALLTRADGALYRAKADGRSRLAVAPA
jgi:diguanylate cyclase (GGDEF)-like protein/PAS domain S-box-containing protein